MAAENKLLHKARETVKYDSSSSVENADQDDPIIPAAEADHTDREQVQREKFAEHEHEKDASNTGTYVNRTVTLSSGII